MQNESVGPNAGHVRVFQNIANSWIQLGADIDAIAAGDAFGNSVSLSADGSTLAVGAPNNDNSNGIDSGHVRIFTYNSGTWTQKGNIINGQIAGDFSSKVSLSSDGNIVAIGSDRNDNNGTDSGHVRIFSYSSNIWTQIGNDINGESVEDRSGSFVSLSGDGSIVAIGSISNDVNGIDSGNVRIFKNENNVWFQKGISINGESAGDLSGSSIALSESGNTIIIGATLNDGNGSDAGHARIFDLTSVLKNNTFTQEKFIISPNPTKDYITLKLDYFSPNQEITITDILGKVIYNQKLKSLSTTVNTVSFEKGIYFLNLEDGTQKTTKKFIIE